MQSETSRHALYGHFLHNSFGAGLGEGGEGARIITFEFDMKVRYFTRTNAGSPVWRSLLRPMQRRRMQNLP